MTWIVLKALLNPNQPTYFFTFVGRWSFSYTAHLVYNEILHEIRSRSSFIF